jgi:radical SAM superfamily enzyme YgiQ (UPF0313 family)
MIELIKEIETDWYLIQLKDTRYYQIWNKWDLFELLLDAEKPFTLWDEDFPVTEEYLKEIVDKLKKQKEKNNGKDNN